MEESGDFCFRPSFVKLLPCLSSSSFPTLAEKSGHHRARPGVGSDHAADADAVQPFRSILPKLAAVLNVLLHQPVVQSGIAQQNRHGKVHAARFLNLFGIRDAAVTAEIYRYITETPANYLKYYIGYLKFYELKKEMADALGNQFSQKEFHRAVLDVGPAPFEIVYDEVEKNLLD